VAAALAELCQPDTQEPGDGPKQRVARGRGRVTELFPLGVEAACDPRFLL